MLQLSELDKLTKDRKRVGRGGDRGGTSGRGHKGQRSRTSGKLKSFFEGGQMPLSRRLPKRGFTNVFKKDVRYVNVGDLETKFDAGDIVNKVVLCEKGIFKGKKKYLIKILGKGKLTKNLVVEADMFSKSAADAIKKAGGKVTISEEKTGGSPIT